MSKFRQIWLETKYPDQFDIKTKSRIQELIRELMPPGITLENIDDYSRKQWADFMQENYDTRILSDMGITADSFLRTISEAGQAQKKGGVVRAEKRDAAKMRFVAAEFLKAERLGKNYTETVADTLQACESSDLGSEDKTIRKWLSAIAGKPWSDIPKATRGRPKNR